LFGLGLAAVAGGAASAFGIACAATAAFGPGTVWAAPVAAAVGVLVGVLPLGGVLSRRAGAAQAAAQRGSALTSRGMARPLFMDLAQREWARARRYGSGAALLLIDVDRYARLCEARGPHAGDVVLNELLRLTAPTLRPADILTRYSETQIAVLLAQSDATGALDVAERIRERAEQIEVKLESAAAPPQKLRVTVSAGVAHLRPAHLSLQALIDDAEDAVAAARQAGGNCVRSAPVEAGRARSSGAGRAERRAQPNQDGAA
jgi:diguanylate cyclase (GGDEF)-like protein